MDETTGSDRAIIWTGSIPDGYSTAPITVEATEDGLRIGECFLLPWEWISRTQASPRSAADEVVLVPVTPTKEMIESAWAEAHEEDAEGVWREMIARSPFQQWKL